MTRSGSSTSPWRDGMGLMLALVAVMVVSSVCTTLLLLMQVRGRARHTDAIERRFLDLLQDAEVVAADWLAKDGRTMVGDPAREGICILDDTPRSGDRAGVTIVVYDVAGGLPAHLMGTNGVLATLKPVLFADVTIPVVPAGAPGQPSDLLERIVLGTRHRFPDPDDWHGHRDRGSTREAALAEWLSPHSDGRVNVNTLPVDLLSGLLKIQPLQDAEDLMARREAGQRIVLTGNAGQRGVVRYTDEATGWGVLITVRFQGRARSWWVVFAAGDAGPVKVQRHDV